MKSRANDQPSRCLLVAEKGFSCTLPAELITLLLPFTPLFSSSVCQHVLTLVAGAILTMGPRTVSVTLRAVGLSHTRQFQNHRLKNYRRVLNLSCPVCTFISRCALLQLPF
jgi:hypothetical protein